MKIVLASNNRHKVEEIKAIINRDVSKDIELLTLRDVGYTDEIEETGSTFEENALIKARAAASLGYISMADDSGLSVDALGGQPGIYSARYAGEPCDNGKNNEKLLSALAGVPFEKRGAKFVSTIALIYPKEGKEYTARGECTGKILEEPRGENGFGYDPLFLFEPEGKTFAELPCEVKNTVSHRANAMKEFILLLKNTLTKFGDNYADK